jgi:diguanylate cyclase (GGDEF)-like protein/PAS domain S-box-containing protein
MIATTIIISMSVKPRCDCKREGSGMSATSSRLKVPAQPGVRPQGPSKRRQSGNARRIFQMIGETELRQLDELLSDSPLALAAMSRDFRMTYWSKRACEMLGYTAEEMLGKHPREMGHADPRDVGAMLDFRRNAVSEGLSSFWIQTRPMRKDGSRRTLRWTTALIQDDERYNIVLLGEDITDTLQTQSVIERREHELAESEGRLRSLFAHNPDPVLALDLDGIMIDCNDAAERVSGLSREAIIGNHYTAYLPPDVRTDVGRAFAQAAQGQTSSMTFTLINGQGRHLTVDGTIIPQYLGDSVVGIYAIFQDITERRDAEDRAQGQQKRVRDLYYLATSARNPESRIVASLEMGTRAFGLSAGAVVDTTSGLPRLLEVYRAPGSPIVSDERLLTAARAVQEAPLSAVSIHGVATPIHVGGERYGMLVFTSAGGAPENFSETDADLLGLMATLIGGTIESDRSRAQLRALAYFDTLTGLPNRAYMAEKLRDAIEVSLSRFSRTAVLYLNLDGFKDVNDTLGHARGDRLLQLVAQRIVDVVGDRGMVARMGGDEFVVLVPEIHSSDDARLIAEQLISTVAEPFMLDEYEQFISLSIGIAIYPEDARDDQTLIKNADIAMTRAKDRGRNGYYFYNPTLEAPIHMRLSQEKMLRRALDLNEFVVFYQPQLDLRTNRVVSVEALVRWNHPKSGLISPANFIPSAEISGLIVQLGSWVLSTAARQVKSWIPTLGRIRLAVNLSARQFHDRELRQRIADALAEAQFAPESFEVEITESVAMADAAQTADIVRDLSAHGIRVALDDFGTGYSSLAYLRSFNIHVLKIDASFVAGIGRSTGDETIVNTVIGMAHSLDLEVIAEGVETREQLAFLVARGCDAVQGYAIAAAMPAAEFETFMAARESNTA